MSFFQMEGLVVDEGVTLADLKGRSNISSRELLGEDLKFRFRPISSRFTEPKLRGRLPLAPGSQVKARNGSEYAAAAWSIRRCSSSRLRRWRNIPAMLRLRVSSGSPSCAYPAFPTCAIFTENVVRFLRQFSTRIDS